MNSPVTTPYALGIDLGGSSVKSVAVTEAGAIQSKRQVDFDPQATMDWAREIAKLVKEYTQQLKAVPDTIGVAAPGLVSDAGDAIAFMPGRLAGLEGFHWADYLRTPKPIPVLNDAHAALLGECWLGAARGLRNVILITLGTGVGGAAMVDGRLLRGEIGRAGHLGHASLDPHGTPDICGTPGSLELAIGNCTVQERSQGRYRTTHDLVRAFSAGEPEAKRIWIHSVHQLAAAITSFINILDPAAVILGGGIARSGDALLQPLQSRLDEIEWRPGGHRVRLLPAQLGEYAGALGAARQAWIHPTSQR